MKGQYIVTGITLISIKGHATIPVTKTTQKHPTTFTPSLLCDAPRHRPYLAGLSDSVSAGEGLDVVVWVPVRVVDDDGVGRGQVDTQTSGPGG